MDKNQITHPTQTQQEQVAQKLTRLEAKLEAREEAIKNLQKEMKELKINYCCSFY